MEDDRYYIRTGAGYFINRKEGHWPYLFRGLVVNIVFFREIENGAGPFLIQALIHFDDFPVTGLPAVMVIIHTINK
jgi:hypothetical protein